MEERWDIYDKNKQLTGRTMKRNDWTLKDDEYHLTVLGVIRRSDGKFLITKRVMTKAWAPGWWEVSGGAAQAGEASYDAVLREVKEETGLDVKDAEGGYMFTYKRENPGEGDNYFVDVYRFTLDIDDSDVNFQEAEIDGYMFASIDEIKVFAQEGIFLHYDSIKRNKYEIDMCNGTIMDKLISFSLPLMLSGILQLMFNAVDIIVIGRFSGSQSLAAVGSTTALINMFTNLFIGISLGANVLSARFYAAGKDKEMSETVHTAITLALISGIIMVFVGLIFAKPVLELMDTPDDVINLSTLYMRIYFMGMPFFMLYNYGASILRAVGDTKRPLFYLIVAGIANAGLNMCLVIIFHLGVAGVAIGTVISQLISSILVLRCLYRSETSYQLRFSKLKIQKEYLKQIFQVGIPAGIQSTVINFSNVLLQSSVNSFGSIAMAGYTAANNIFGFLYVTVNAVTQACMSFTSQNYGVGKWKRMDRVLIDCLILSFVAMMILGNSAYFFGPKLLTIYTSNSKVIQCGMEILLYTTVTYFLCGFMDLFPGALRGMGRSGVPMILSIIGTVGTRIVWIFWIFPNHRSLDILFISYPASWIITIVLQVICYYFVRKQLYAKMRAEA